MYLKNIDFFKEIFENLELFENFEFLENLDFFKNFDFLKIIQNTYSALSTKYMYQVSCQLDKN